MKTLKIKTENGFEHSINCNDSDIITIDGNVIFVEGEKYLPKLGDILLTDNIACSMIYIYKENHSYFRIGYFAMLVDDSSAVHYNKWIDSENNGISNKRLATEDEKQQLFDALAKDGKFWNPDTIEIEELRWKPKLGEKYYYFSSWVKVSSCNCINDSVDSDRFNVGNCFKTESECLAKIEQIKAILK